MVDQVESLYGLPPVIEDSMRVMKSACFETWIWVSPVCKVYVLKLLPYMPMMSPYSYEDIVF